MKKRKANVKRPKKHMSSELVTVEAECADCYTTLTVTIENMGMIPIILCTECIKKRARRVSGRKLISDL